MIASHLKHGVAVAIALFTTMPSMASGRGQGKGLLTQVTSVISDSAFSFPGSQTATVGSAKQRLGLRELLALGYEVAAGVLGSRQDMVKGVLRGMATSLMTPLAASQGAM